MTDINIKKSIEELKPFDPVSYENLDLDRLSAFASMTLEELKVPLYFDYMAVALFKLFPKKFSMASFSEYPDTNRISKSLRRLVDPKRKNWATGNLENGFFLTEVGKEIGRQTRDLLNHPNQQREAKTTAKRSRGRSPMDDVLEIKKTGLFLKWQNGNREVTEYEILSFLKAVPYTPKYVLADYIKQLRQSVSSSTDNEAKEFLVWVEIRFETIFK